MTNNLVPNFILNNYSKHEYGGRFPATALFVDISGFSAITDQLMEHGQHGAEVLAGVMGAIFEPLINAVYRQGGFVIGFAGDAFTAVFPQAETTPLQALAAAIAIQEQMEAKPEQKTPYGRFTMSAKVGLASGEVFWGIVNSEDETRASYYFQGTAIDGCAEAEHTAGPGDVILDAAYYKEVQDSISTEAIGNHYRLTAVTSPLPLAQELNPPQPDLELLSRFVPRAAIRAGRTGEFRHVVNLFISLPTVRTEAQLDIFMQTVFNLQERYGGLLKQLDYGDKGAKLLLFWGAPVTYENDIQRALHFILDLQTQTAIPINGGLTYHIAHAGYIGSSLRGEYTCYGRGVNLAARFMAAAPRGEIWVDEHIARRAGGQFDLAFEGQQQFKGFSEPQKIYILFERKDTADRLYDGRLVGRESELGQLSEFVRPIYNGRSPGMLVVWGEPGAGKSRLAYEFLTHHLNDQQDTQVFLAQSDEIIRQSLNPFRYWLKRYFSQSEGLAENRNKRSFNRKLDTLIAEIDDQRLEDELDQVRSFLGALVGLHWSDSYYEQVEAKERFEKTLSGLTILLQAESRRQPVILLLEDAHWMDKDSAAFLASLLSELNQSEETTYPLAVLATARYEGHGLPKEGFAYQELNLSVLNRANLAALVQVHLKAPPSDKLVDLLVDRAEGNPFFAEQLLRYLQEANQLQLVEERWQVVALETSPLPEDVNALLVARLDRLTQAVREVVQTAAVLGREFEVRLLSQMLQEDAALTDKIAQAEKESIWSALSEIRFIFKHGLLRDAAYRMQLRARRQALHKLAMEAIERLFAADLTGHFGELAYHALAANLPEPAFRYGLAAGNEAMERYAAAEAVFHYQEMMNQLEKVHISTEQYLQICTQYGRALELIGSYAAALSHYEKMNQVGRQIGDQHLELAALVAMGTIRSTGNVMSNFDLAESLGQEGLELAAALNDKTAEVTILWNLLNTYRHTGRYKQSMMVGQQAYDLAESLNLRGQMAYIANDLNTSLMGLGKIKRMDANGMKAVKLFREIKNQPMLVDSLVTHGMAVGMLGRLDEAMVLANEAISLSQAANNLWGEAYARFITICIHLQKLEIEQGLENTKIAFPMAEESGAVVVQVYLHLFQSLLYLAAKDYQQMLTWASQGLSLAEQHLPVLVTMLKGSLIIANVELGKFDKAAEFVNSYELEIDELNMLRFLSPQLGKCHYLLSQEAYADVLTITNQVVEITEREGIYFLTPQFYYYHGQALQALNEHQKAREIFQNGLVKLRKAGINWGYVELATSLAELEQVAGNDSAAAQLLSEIKTIENKLKKH